MSSHQHIVEGFGGSQEGKRDRMLAVRARRSVVSDGIIRKVPSVERSRGPCEMTSIAAPGGLVWLRVYALAVRVSTAFRHVGVH